MVAKTPNKNRKSFANAKGDTKSPNAGKVGSPQKGQGKGKGNASPGKFNKTPKSPVANVAKTPQQTPKNKAEAPEKKNNKRPNEAAAESSPSKKLKMFEGTGQVAGASKKKEGKKPAAQNKNDAQETKRKGQFFHLKERIVKGEKAALEEVDEKLKAFAARKDLTKTAKRKIKYLQRMKSILTGEKPQVKVAPSASKKRRERQKNVKNQQKSDKQPKGKSEQQKKTETLNVSEEAETDSDESAEDSNVDVDNAILKIGEVLAAGEGADSDDDLEEEESDDEAGEEEEDEDDSDADEDDSDAEEVEEEEAKPQPQTKGKQNLPPQSQPSDDGKRTRYVVFVGNLPYDVTKPELSEHFVKAGQIRHIRIPTDVKTKKPRGFAYVEFDDEVSYQKALSLHHTSIKGRRINCLYTQGGKKQGEEKKKQVKEKNFKIEAMRKKGQLAGSVKENQKRSARRNKQNVNGSN